MSKRVEVRKGDWWTVDVGVLTQIRGNQWRSVASNGIAIDVWEPMVNAHAYTLDSEVARFWVERHGGEWAEVAEEKAATPTTLTLHVYGASQGSVLFNINRCEVWGAKYLGTTTITIAGVTP
jgi:hypothetical protein